MLVTLNIVRQQGQCMEMAFLQVELVLALEAGLCALAPLSFLASGMYGSMTLGCFGAFVR